MYYFRSFTISVREDLWEQLVKENPSVLQVQLVCPSLKVEV
jgi:hypothetical protein